MDKKLVEINGQTFDLNEPEGKKAAIRAWLAAKSKGREAPAPPEASSQEADGQNKKIIDEP